MKIIIRLSITNKEACQVCQITGKMDEQSFASLRQAIQIEYRKEHKDTKVDSLADLQYPSR